MRFRYQSVILNFDNVGHLIVFLKNHAEMHFVFGVFVRCYEKHASLYGNKVIVEIITIA